MSWFKFGEKRRKQEQLFLDAIQSIAKSHAQNAEMVMRAVDKITDSQREFAITQREQIGAITQHLSLFKLTDTPTATSMDGRAGELAEMEQQGFPFSGSPKDQAAWLEKHIDDD